MPLINLFELNGAMAGQVEVSEHVFSVPVNMAVIHQVVVAHLANCRQGTASTKTRGDVSGGGKKPWRQKHTGRARQGSNRSPIWVGGGVAHGPHTRDYHQKVNRKVRQMALKCVLSDKFREELIAVVRGFNEITKPSTKIFAELISSLDFTKTLVIYSGNSLNVAKSVSNLPNVRAINVASINTYDVLNAKYLIIAEEALAKIEEVFSR